MKPFIQITRHYYEEPYTLNMFIIASNGQATGSLEFYLKPDNLKDIGKNLLKFPLHERSTYLFERGSERPEDNFGWYFRLRAYAKNNLKKCAIQFRFNNNETHVTLPNRNAPSFIQPQLTDFCIDIDVNEIRQFGQLLIELSKMKEDRLYWSPDDIYLDTVFKRSPKYHGHVDREAFDVLPK